MDSDLQATIAASLADHGGHSVESGKDVIAVSEDAFSVELTDTDGDVIMFMLVDGDVQQYVNGNLKIARVTSLSLDESAGRVKDPTGMFTVPAHFRTRLQSLKSLMGKGGVEVKTWNSDSTSGASASTPATAASETEAPKGFLAMADSGQGCTAECDPRCVLRGRDWEGGAKADACAIIAQQLQHIAQQATSAFLGGIGKRPSALERLAQLSGGFFSVDGSFCPVYGAKTPVAVLECDIVNPGYKRIWDFTRRCFTEQKNIPDPRKRPASWRLSELPDHLESECKALVKQMQCGLSKWCNRTVADAANESAQDGIDYARDTEQQAPTCGTHVERAAKYLDQGHIFSSFSLHLSARKEYEKSLEAAEDDVESVCQALRAVGSACLLLQDFETASDKHKLRIELAGDELPQQKYEALLDLANVSEANNDSTQALQHCSEAIETARAASVTSSASRAFFCNALGQVGAAHCRLGSFGQAVSLHSEQLHLAMLTGKRRQVVQALMGFGNVCFSLGQHEAAVDMYRESLSVARISTDKAMVDMLTYNTGNAHFALGEFDAAGEYFRLRNDQWDGTVYATDFMCTFLNTHLGTMHCKCSENLFFLRELFGRAVREYNSSLLSAIQTRNVANEYGSYIMQGRSYCAAGYFEPAMKMLRCALAVTDREWNDEPEHQPAPESYRLPIQLQDRAPAKWNETRTLYRCVTLGCIGRTWLLQGEWSQAIEVLEEYLQLAQALASAVAARESADVLEMNYGESPAEEERAACQSLFTASFEAGEHVRALEYHERYVELAEKTGDVIAGTEHLDFGALFAEAKDAITEHQAALRAQDCGEGGREEMEGRGREREREGEGLTEGEKRGREHLEALLGLGDVYLRCGLPVWAARLFRQARSMADTAKDIAGSGRACGRLADVLRAEGDLEGAIDMGQSQLECARKGADQWGEYSAYKKLGELLTEQGKAEEGLSIVKEWRGVAEARGDEEQAGEAKASLIAALSKLGRVDEVLIARGEGERQAIQSASTKPSAVTDGWLRRGDDQYHLGELGSAVELYSSQMQIAAKSSDVRMQMQSARRLGRAFVRMGHHVKGRDVQNAALQIAKQLNDKVLEGEVVNDCGDRYLSMALRGCGHEHWFQDLFAETEARKWGMETVHKGLQREWYTDGARGNYEHALKVMRDSGNLGGQVQAHAGLGRLDRLEQSWSESTKHHEEQLNLAVRCGDVMAQGQALLDLAKTALLMRGSGQGGAVRVGDILSQIWSSVERFRSVERRLGSFDQQRISLLELQQEGLQLLQTTLLAEDTDEKCGGEKTRALLHTIRPEAAGMALAVAEHAKARALLHTIRLEAAEHRANTPAESDAADASTAEMEWDDLREHLRHAWEKVRSLGRSERPGVVMVEYSFLESSKLAVWVLSNDGELRSSQVLDCDVDLEVLFGGLPGWTGTARVEPEAVSSSSCLPSVQTHRSIDDDTPVSAKLEAYHRGNREWLTKEFAQALDKEQAAVGCFSLGALVEMTRAAIGVARRDLRGPSSDLEAPPHGMKAERSGDEVGHEADERFDRLFRTWSNFQEGQGLTEPERVGLTKGVLPAHFEELDTAYANPKLLARLEQAWEERKLVSYTLEKLRTANSASTAGSPEEVGQAREFGEAVMKLAARAMSWRDLKEFGCKASRIEQDCGVVDALAARRLAEAVRSLMKPRRLLAALHHLLIAPIEAHLLTAEEILLVPHRDLFEIPWAALGPANGPYLIQQFALRVSPSLSVAAELARTLDRQPASESAAPAAAVSSVQPRDRRALVVGNPLPCKWQPLAYAEEEARDVTRMLAGALTSEEEKELLAEPQAWQHTSSSRLCVDMLVREKASRRAVSGLLAGCEWAHLACHGDLDNDSLLLAPDMQAGSSGDLSMTDVHGGVRLARGATVVISACNSGRGKVRGEGVVGLSRGFLAAGAACAVVSLWHLPDKSTCQFMRHFYTCLQQGMSTPAASRSAMLTMANLEAVPPSGFGVEQPKKRRKRCVAGPDFSELACWAPFIVTGASTHLGFGDVKVLPPS